MPSGDRIPDRRPRRDVSQDGYNLVVLAVIVTLLNIWIAATLPLWSHQIQRDRENELIFRGLQYAEAIRVYLLRTGQYPTSVHQLIENEPRCIRRLWENPLRDDGQWALIPVGTGGPGQGQGGQGGRAQGQGGQGAGQPGGQGGNVGGQGGAQGARGQGTGGQGGADRQGGLGGQEPGDEAPAVIMSGPLDPRETVGKPASNVAFRGVFSPTDVDSIRKFQDKETVSEWRFTVELVSALRQGTPDRPIANPRPFMIEQIGRPWPPGVVPTVAMPTPDGQPGQQGQGGGQGDGGERPADGRDLRGPGAPRGTG